MAKTTAVILLTAVITAMSIVSCGQVETPLHENKKYTITGTTAEKAEITIPNGYMVSDSKPSSGTFLCLVSTADPYDTVSFYFAGTDADKGDEAEGRIERGTRYEDNFHTGGHDVTFVTGKIDDKSTGTKADYWYSKAETDNGNLFIVEMTDVAENIERNLRDKTLEEMWNSVAFSMD